MKSSPIYLSGILITTALAMFTTASAQSTPTAASPTSTINVPPPPPPPPPPPRTSSGSTVRGGPFRPITVNGRTIIPRGSLPEDTTWTSEEAMNDAFIQQFNNTGSFGSGRMPAPTMRISPGMRVMLTEQVKFDGPAKSVTMGYRIYSLELIGIAKHDTPVAFVVIRHQDNSASVVNRVLTDFEAGAIKQLQDGKQVVDQLDQTDRLVVGAVRAEASCIECHSGYKVGDLLGAFSYHLSPVADSAARARSMFGNPVNNPPTQTSPAAPTVSIN